MAYATPEKRRAWYKTPAGIACRQKVYRKRMIRNYTFINEYKRNKGCIDCGYSRHPAALDFDHVTGEKKCSIGNMGMRSLRLIKEEIAKCVVRCANCHRIKTWKERKTLHGFNHRYEVADTQIREADVIAKDVSQELTEGETPPTSAPPEIEVLMEVGFPVADSPDPQATGTEASTSSEVEERGWAQ